MEFSNYIETVKGKSAYWIIKNTDVSIVNALRRIIISEIPNVALSDVVVINNNTDYHNEFLSHRISMLPVFFDQEEIDSWIRQDYDKSYEFRLDAFCDKEVTKTVYSGDILITKNGKTVSSETKQKLFPANRITRNHVMLMKLKKGQSINVFFKATLGTAKTNDTRWSPVSCCCHRMISDNTFEFEVESECSLTPKYLFSKAIDILYEKLRSFLGGISTGHPNALKSKDIQAINESFYTITIENHDQAMCSVLQHILSRNSNVSFCSYYQPHPLKSQAIFKLEICPKSLSRIKNSLDVFQFLTNIDLSIILDMKKTWNQLCTSSSEL